MVLKLVHTEKNYQIDDIDNSKDVLLADQPDLKHFVRLCCLQKSRAPHQHCKMDSKWELKVHFCHCAWLFRMYKTNASIDFVKEGFEAKTKFEIYKDLLKLCSFTDRPDFKCLVTLRYLRVYWNRCIALDVHKKWVHRFFKEQIGNRKIFENYRSTSKSSKIDDTPTTSATGWGAPCSTPIIQHTKRKC